MDAIRITIPFTVPVYTLARFLSLIIYHIEREAEDWRKERARNGRAGMTMFERMDAAIRRSGIHPASFVLM
jgi:hypothetical protein